MNVGCAVSRLIAACGILISSLHNVHSQSVPANWNPLFVPDIDRTSGIVIELLPESQGTNAKSVRRYSWRSGDFVSEAGLADEQAQLQITNIYTASGRVKGRTWEYRKGSLIWHEGQNVYNSTFKGRTAAEVSLLGYLSRGMENEDFATIELAASGAIKGKWHSTSPIQEMVGHIEELGSQVWKLEATTPNRLLRFETQMYFLSNVSAVLPATIKYRQILDSEESQVTERKLLYAVLDRADEEFDPHKRYKPSSVLKMENDVVVGADRSGKLVHFSAERRAKTPGASNVRVLAFGVVAASGVLLWVLRKQVKSKKL